MINHSSFKPINQTDNKSLTGTPFYFGIAGTGLGIGNY
jgi:hypothetical protein